MKILKLVSENIKRLSAVEIAPDGHTVIISGRNGAGKTSVLDSIWWALAGTAHIQSQPIRKGANKARIALDLGGDKVELKVERRFTEKGSSLIVENTEGARFTSPQALLDGLLGALSFDPLEFARMEPRAQFTALRGMVPLAVDIDELERLNTIDYNRRTETNRDAKALRARAEAIPVHEGLPAEPIDEGALLDAVQKVGEANAEIERRRARREAAHQKIETLQASITSDKERAAQLRRQAEILDRQAEKTIAELKSLAAQLEAAGPLPPLEDVAPIRARLNEAKATNAFIASRAQRARLEEEANGLEARGEALTKAMEARRTAGQEAIAAAKMPVGGLGFGAGAVSFNGLPFEQASDAEKLRVSLAIAMASNPKLRVIRIRDGSLLDDESLAQIAAAAQAQDYQVWIERVDSSGKVGIVIEAGVVASINP